MIYCRLKYGQIIVQDICWWRFCSRDAPLCQGGASLIQEEVDLRRPLVQLHLLLLLLNCNLVQTRVGHRCAAEVSTGGSGLQTLLLILLLNLNLPHLLLSSVCSGHSDHSTIWVFPFVAVEKLTSNKRKSCQQVNKALSFLNWTLSSRSCSASFSFSFAFFLSRGSSSPPLFLLPLCPDHG